MRDYFHGWRRKAGFVTLVMACAVTAGWIRSLVWTDGVLIWIGSETAYYVSSTPHLMRFQRMLQAGSRLGIMDDDEVTLPFCYFAIPLTLLSAHLILGKRHQAPKPNDLSIEISHRHKDTERDGNEFTDNSDLLSVPP